MNRCLIGVVLLSSVTFGQGGPTFEVASIRPSSEQVTEVSAGVGADLGGGSSFMLGNNRLESRKAPLEVIVVDAIAKAPTEN